jgi:hypothetical protein
MDNSMYDLAMELSTRVGKLLGAVGAQVKYPNSSIDNFTFRQLAKTYIETVHCQDDIDAVMEQAKIRGVDLT